MLKLSEIYHNYLDQDPIKVFQNGAIKSAVIFFLFLTITSTFDIDKNLIIIGILFIANLAVSVLLGSIQAKRNAFFLYMISAITVVNVSPYLHDIFRTDFMLIVIVVFIAFWVRRFGEAFLIFPVMVIVLACICFVRYPLEEQNQLGFTVTAILIGLAFYILLIRTYKIMTPEELSKIINDFIKLFTRNYIDTFEKSKFRRFTQTDIMKVSSAKYTNIDSLKNHGLMFLPKKLHDSWRYLNHNFVVFNRLASRFVLNYKKLNANYVRLGFVNGHEAQMLSQDLEAVFKQTIFLMLYIQKDAEYFEKKCEEVEHLKYKLEMNYIEKYQNDLQKRKIFFNSILLLDDMFISLENIKEACHDLI